ncbi:hypothetical protein D3C80_1774650 [compost metagenome]
MQKAVINQSSNSVALGVLLQLDRYTSGTLAAISEGDQLAALERLACRHRVWRAELQQGSNHCAQGEGGADTCGAQ